MTEATSPSAIRSAVSRVEPADELVIGLVGPAGTDLELVTRELRRAFGNYDYKVEVIRLSKILENLSGPKAVVIPESPEDERIWAAMEAGNTLRSRWGRNDALALLSVSAIGDYRIKAQDWTDDGEDLGAPALSRHAYVLRSLKTPAEVTTLQEIYGSRFYLIGAQASETARVEQLRNQIAQTRGAAPQETWTHAPSALIARDWHEEQQGGQDVSGTFHLADFFVSTERRQVLRAAIERFLRVVFGDPFATPTLAEYAMFEAAGASRRSAEFGRQVGAAIASPIGSIIALGVNEVPKAGGGPYREGDNPDARELTKDKDSNRAQRDKIASELDVDLTNRFDEIVTNLKPTKKQASAVSEAIETVRDGFFDGLTETLLEPRLGRITEFGRAVHAEMSAMIDAARRGVAVSGAVLYVTTSPCHTCARHAIDAGISTVIFIEPYPKGRALELHSDALFLDEGGSSHSRDPRVRVQPFVGVAPRRYLQLFDASWRAARKDSHGYLPRDESGVPTDFHTVMREVVPVLYDLEALSWRLPVPSYRFRERAAGAALPQLLRQGPNVRSIYV